MLQLVEGPFQQPVRLRKGEWQYEGAFVVWLILGVCLMVRAGVQGGAKKRDE